MCHRLTAEWPSVSRLIAEAAAQGTRSVRGVEQTRNQEAAGMKSAGMLVVVAVLTGACTAGAEPSLGPAPLALGEDGLGVAFDEGSSELVLEMEPVELPAGAGHAVQQPRAGEATLPMGGWLRGYRVELIDTEGRAVPRELIHHVNMMAPERRELFSPVMQRIGAVGAETAPVVLPRIFGYPIAKGDRVLVSAMLHNPTEQTWHGVRVRVRFLYSDGAGPGPIPMYPFYMDVTPPATLHSFDLPPGHFEQSWEATPAIDGRMMLAGGHLHQHAVALRLEDVTAGKVLYETAPITDETGAVTGMPQDNFLWRLGVPIRAGNTYRLTAVYQNDTGATIPSGGMGALGGVFVPSRGAVWPDVDVDNPEYVTDFGIRTTHQDPVEMVGAPHSHRH